LLPSGEMARARLFCAAAAVFFSGALAVGCGSSPPVDQNLGTNLGADFRAPITDAGATGDTSVTPESGVGGAGSGGTGGGTAGAGAAGAGGAAGQTGSDAAAGSAGAAGAG
jgi:hypothetical protein